MDIQQNNLYQTIREIITLSRQRIYRMANSALLETYWQIGKIIVEDEQNGQAKAEYGKATLKNLSNQLTMEFGKGFDDSNLRNMRAFYKAFPIRDTLRHELSWSHYRLLSRLDSEQKRNYYLAESIASNWNSRELQRPDDNPSIGILLCSEKDETIVKYSILNDKNNLFASKYLLYLPKEEELKQLIEQNRLNFELDNE